MYKKFLIGVGLGGIPLLGYASDIVLTVPPMGNNEEDLGRVINKPIEGSSDLVIHYIQLVNQYLRFAMIVLLFAVLIWMGYKLITNDATEPGKAKKVLKDGLVAIGVGLIIIMLSYTVVRLLINMF